MPDDANPNRTARRRDWVFRALFESGLIVLSIIGAFALNEWQASREREKRVRALMSAVRAEIESNLRLMEDANKYNAEVVQRLRKLREEGATAIPDEAHPRGLIIRPQLVSAAWDSAKSSGVLNDIPVDTVLLLGGVYESQEFFLDSTGSLMDMIYGSFFQESFNAFSRPGLLAGVLSDFAGRGRGLSERYRLTLSKLSP